MTFKKFKYTKKSDNETKDYFVLVLDENKNPQHFGGIELGLLDDEEISQLITIQSKYEEAIKPFVKKAYRLFIEENINELDPFNTTDSEDELPDSK